MVTDKISDFINGLKNANKAGKDVFIYPETKMVRSIAELLEKQGYIESVQSKDKNAKKEIKITLKYTDSKPAITDTKRISKFSKRIYRGSAEIKPVKRGLGIAVLTTPKGILTNKEAREQNVGGELMFEIW
jgi:small subunit ribosomal protein S8